jgi:hypothetical protein
MQRIATIAATFTILTLTAALAEENANICSYAEQEESCTELHFDSGLPESRYKETLEAIANEVESDFSTYLRETHGPFRQGVTPTIDYKLNLFSAEHSSRTYGFHDFVVLASSTKTKPFGIVVIKSGVIIHEINASFGSSEYAITEMKGQIHFLYRERFSGETVKIKLN